ncbi:ATP-dependent DNA helicase Q4 [Rhinophrynus dorsalis]
MQRYNEVKLLLKKWEAEFLQEQKRKPNKMWKQKWQKKGEKFGGGGKHFNHSDDTCFRCGGIGHWASQCPGKAVVVMQQEPDTGEEEEEVSLPTLEDVARMTNTQLRPSLQEDAGRWCENPGRTLDVVRPVYEPSIPPPAMQPLYEVGPEGKVKDPPSEVYETLTELGYSKFRPGQEEAVMRILSGLSSLVILSTGMGKSLCYQLPAYMYAKRSRCITLVISPLVSLMDDQVSGLPPKLKAVCIHSNMTKAQREAAIEKVKQGKVHVLLLSPEALVGGGYSGSSCLPSADQLPPVAFACIDEAHCVSEWSHNFRPCYLRICKVLRERLGVNCLLGLTATATRSTAEDVARHLGVREEDAIPERLAAVPPNLNLSVSMDNDRDQALVTLLKGERFGCLDSIIVYCTRREETKRIAALLRTALQGVTVSKSNTVERAEDENKELNKKKAEALKKIRRPLKWLADSYHAGMSAAERRRVQNNFMSGQLRVVVATVAFGMGLDKSDVRGIIHYNMPKNFESYVQEIGRAGRDGRDAECHLFLDPKAQDLDELRRHVYGDSVDYFTVKRLVQRVFPKCKCRDLHQKQELLKRGQEVDDGELLDFLEQCEKPEAAFDIKDPAEGTLEHVCTFQGTAGGAPVRKGQSPAEGTQMSTCEPQGPLGGIPERVCHRHERALSIEETVQMLDMREEGIETLLCYLELHPQRWLELLHPTLSACRITCYCGPQQLRKLATSCPPVAVSLARERLAGKDHKHTSTVEFNVVEVADSMGWEVVPVKRSLRQLQWHQQQSTGFQGTGRSGVLVEFSKLSFHFRSYGDLTDQELDDLCDFLHHKVISREQTALQQLRSCYQAFQSVGYRNSSACAEHISLERSTRLKALLLDYFQRRDPAEQTPDMDSEVDSELDLQHLKVQEWQDQVRCDVRHFLSIHEDERFSGRAIARIFHGIGNPCYPAQVYGRDRRFWRKYLHLDFNEIMKLCKEEIIRLK